MATNTFPNIGYTRYGRDWNYFQKFTITNPAFGGNSVDGYQPDIIFTFPTRNITIINEGIVGSATKTAEYSFNGTTVHGESSPQFSALISKTFNNRRISKMWFRAKTGSSGSIVISVEAWGVINGS